MIRWAWMLAVCLLVACSGSELKESSETQKAPEVSPSDSSTIDSAAVELVARFYSEYAPRAIRSGLLALDSTLVETPGVFTPELLAALRRDAAARAAAAGYINGLDFEPFLNSQDPCEQYELGAAEQVGARIRVQVFAVCRGVRTSVPAVVVEVSRTVDGWAIGNLLFGPPANDVLSLSRRLHP